MRIAILLGSAAPLGMAATCWLDCGCTVLCPVAGAVACLGIAAVAGAGVFVIGSIAWELYLLSERKPLY